ncbi:hypothetical protein JSE7799_01440 [Jannaschia seosinensis]|uniref:Uncharacterized protein n=1 Tax=Jannaschia seosinensis TaxID=313367 RepID=A0A0M7B8M8_9RHOB|nr:hypothetical protein [Jannaschia seosinensis]CUH38620.1 hypothetical protein JSE7799_01440 [Jannaschia seosinensis]
MNALPSKSLLEQQVDLNRLALSLRRGMRQHLSERVLPHLIGDREQEFIDDLVDALDEDFLLDGDFGHLLDGAAAEIRDAISAGTSEEQVVIPRERMIGGTAAFEMRKTPSPDAEALQAALTPLEEFRRAVWDAVGFAEAIRVSFWMLDQD